MKKITLNQQHTNNIAIYPGNDLTQPFDAIITQKKNIALILKTADCIPIIFYDYKSDTIGVIHAGWKGIYNDIIPKTIKKAQKKFNLSLKDSKFVIGPSIRSCCYEIQNDLKEKFLNKSEKNEKYFIKINNKINLNLLEMALDQFKSLGVNIRKIEIIEQCTQCNKEYYSYRRDKTELRNLSFIVNIK